MEAARVLLCVLSVFAALVSERFVVLAAFSQSLDSDFTFTLPAGRKECFYQTMKKDASLEIEYQVINTLMTGIILNEIVTLAKQTQTRYLYLQCAKSMITPTLNDSQHLHNINITLVKPVDNFLYCYCSRLLYVVVLIYR